MLFAAPLFRVLWALGTVVVVCILALRDDDVSILIDNITPYSIEWCSVSLTCLSLASRSTWDMLMLQESVWDRNLSSEGESR